MPKARCWRSAGACSRRSRYLRRAEKGVQTPAQTLALGSGSCRDMATLMMEAARVLGVAARFASGYLHGASVDGRESVDPRLGGSVSADAGLARLRSRRIGDVRQPGTSSPASARIRAA